MKVYSQAGRRYLRHLCGALVATAIAFAGVNILIDPYDVYGTPRIASLNAKKPELAKKRRISKVYQVDRVKPATILLGNSRVEAGIDPADPIWRPEDAPVYNFAIGGSDLYLQYRYLQHALATRDVRTVVIGLEFLDFLRKDIPKDSVPLAPKMVRNWEARLKVDRHGAVRSVPLEWWKDLYSTTVSVDALSDSASTFVAQFRDGVATTDANGFNPNTDVPKVIEAESYAALFRHGDRLLSAILGNKGYSGARIAVPPHSRDFAVLRALFALQREKNFDLYLYIHPYHARFFALLELAELWDEYEHWKRALLSEVDSAPPTVAIRQLWDFGVFSEMTVELATPRMRAASDLKWFWESGHYKPALGHEMVAAMRDKDTQRSVGSLLQGNTIEHHLAVSRRAKDEFFARNKDLIADVRKLSPRDAFSTANAPRSPDPVAPQ